MAAVAVVLVIGAAGYWFLGRADSAETATTVSEVTTGTFKQTVSGSGTLEPAQQADLEFAVSGRVTAVEVGAGDTVTKGDVLARLDTVSLEASLAAAEAQEEAAETTVANDGSETSTQRAANEASLASARADVAQAQDDLDAATLTATFSGTVASVSVAVGDQAGGSSGAVPGATGTTTTTTSTAAVTLVKPKTFVVDVDVSAADVTDVEEGLQAEITPADATEAIFGTVKDVGKVAETSTSGTATFPVTVSVTGKQEGLYAGTSADVSIVVKQIADVLTVPSQALTTTGGKTYVTKVDGSTTKKTAVTVGETYGASTEITKGLAAGDKVEIAAVGRSRAPGGAGGTGGAGGFPGGGSPPSGGFPSGGQPPAGFPGGGS
ncbi:efflux RND transporter periplasmic adaptor subunit [Aeromicrobium fastidiosum]|uniref:efflux RND transporter periplasmic adaptor subunit n=1 Tax=Aeromicrobium fastidiosum TaxID=52699 RepID=UPI0020233D8A|nr:efflux RND transporter periplasmic adaptor subunit [Aeromicrobium fastidiosum]MCL8251619.1 efflux RND transporter periplasmic adaptor subunit [Aeromicrobium fastidiosum]